MSIFGSNKNVTELVISGDNTGAKKAINQTVEHLDQAERKIQRMSRGWGDALSTMTNVNPMYLLGGAALAAAGGLTAMTVKANQTGVELSKMSALTSLSVEQLSALQKVSEDTGLPMDDLVKSYKTGNSELNIMVTRLIEAGDVMSTDFANGAVNAKSQLDTLISKFGDLSEGIATVINHDLQWFDFAWQKLAATISGENKEELESFAVFQLHAKTKIRLQNEETAVIKTKIEEEKKLNDERRRAAEKWEREQEQRRQKQLAWARKGLESAEGAGGEIMAMQTTHALQMQMIEERKYAITEITDLEMYEWALMNDMAQQTYSNMAGAAAFFYEASGQKSKEWFAVMKGFSVAQALINTYEGATKALAQGGIFGPILAASVIAFGLAQVAAIASQQPGGGYGGGGGGNNAINYPPPIREPREPGGGNGQQIIVNVYGYMGTDKDAMARDFVKYIDRAYGDGAGSRRK